MAIAIGKGTAAPGASAGILLADQGISETGGCQRTVADREGFEPSVPLEEYDGLAIRWFKPLTHLTACHNRNSRIC